MDCQSRLQSTGSSILKRRVFKVTKSMPLPSYQMATVGTVDIITYVPEMPKEPLQMVFSCNKVDIYGLGESIHGTLTEYRPDTFGITKPIKYVFSLDSFAGGHLVIFNDNTALHMIYGSGVPCMYAYYGTLTK